MEKPEKIEVDQIWHVSTENYEYTCQVTEIGNGTNSVAAVKITKAIRCHRGERIVGAVRTPNEHSMLTRSEWEFRGVFKIEYGVKCNPCGYDNPYLVKGTPFTCMKCRLGA